MVGLSSMFPLYYLQAILPHAGHLIARQMDEYTTLQRHVQLFVPVKNDAGEDGAAV